MPIKLTDLIARVPRDVEAKVQRVRDDARSTLQEALRAECRLMMRTPEETERRRPGAQVPPGYPLALEKVEFSADITRILLLGRYRTQLEQARDCVPGLLRLRDELLNLPEPGKWAPASASDLQSAAHWAHASHGAQQARSAQAGPAGERGFPRGL
jgi:hypothetical protein